MIFIAVIKGSLLLAFVTHSYLGHVGILSFSQYNRELVSIYFFNILTLEVFDRICYDKIFYDDETALQDVRTSL